ncbi:GFA family protein [Ideonella oryzae]|uniref:GFA family protein n=1 Tax=Ideonella oryzae TaxID=2937441 RepID=A0ABT1BHA1_9BURK|nr:GFA family protein [Ideonella oryzae]MCO5975590.1 GFA family protein [Ideonella oryzae]
MTTPTRLASCSCGQLTATVQGDPIRVAVCHCLTCQRRTGSVFGAQARFPREAVRTAGTGRTYTRTGDEGGQCRFTFCPECGATVFYSMADQDDFVGIPVGAFADPAFPGPALSVYEERMHSWVTMPQGVAHIV